MRTIATLAVLLFASSAIAADPPEPEVVAGEWLAIGSTDVRGRQPFNPDAVFERYLLDRDSAPPQEGESVTGTRGEPATWTKVAADDKGRLGGRFTWMYRSLTSLQARVVLASLHRGYDLWVNGERYRGDIYGGGMGPVAVPLRAGDNNVFVRGVRGSFKLTLAAPDGPLVVTGRDWTVPDVITGKKGEGLVGGVLVNTTDRWMRITELSTGGEAPFATDGDEVNVSLPPLGVIKLPAPYRLEMPAPPLDGPGEDGKTKPTKIGAEFVALGEYADETGGRIEISHKRFEMRVRPARDLAKFTFRSAIDDSVQEYAVRVPENGTGKALVLSLHGAGVGCVGQARSYSTKPDTWIVAATNRRPFGFDWQDWGRLDAYEVLDHALGWTGAERSRVALTGHSMGGHGTWHLAANDPDGFAAIAPSAAWPTFDTYTGRPDAARRDPWLGADAASMTLGLTSNLIQLPTFVLHGTKDDNVPLDQAETALAALRASGAEPLHHFQEGAGHWWNGDAAKGADCVDWPGIFELFQDRQIPSDPAEIDFMTVDPGVDADHHWVRVEQPLRYGAAARVFGKRDVSGTTIRTHNVRSIQVRAPAGSTLSRVQIDHQTVNLLSGVQTQWLRREGSEWIPTVRGAEPGQKTADLSGPFKRALRNRFLLVVGTAGTPEENRELLARARDDAASWWYRGNGRTEIVTDAAFAFGDFAGRNVIVYGNADTNAAWDIVFAPNCPVRAERGRMTVGDITYERDDLAAVLVRPRLADDNALAAAFADTGPRGTRVGYALLTFVSGVGYPDFAVFGPEVFELADRGVLTAGWFDHAWNIQADSR